MFDYGLPFGVIWIREDLERRFIRQKAIDGRDVVVLEARDGKQHGVHCPKWLCVVLISSAKLE